LLTERANQAGGHDNITVIVVQFDGEALKDLATDPDPLKYRKYALPEAPGEGGEQHRRTLPELRALHATPVPPGAGSGAPQGLGSTFVYSGPPNAGLPSGAPRARAGSSSHPPSYEEERIDIPGTHVPAWVVAVLVVGVILVLIGTALLLLR
jgi:protein phosphatase